MLSPSLFPLLLFRSPSRFSRSMSTQWSKINRIDGKTSLLEGRKQATFRLSKVSSLTTELLEMHSEDPSLHILFIPGNPGVVSFYKEFVEEVYELLEDKASVTAIGHISHTIKDWEHGGLFSLQDQIKHKMDFIRQELSPKGLPLVLVGHSIGSYISLEILKRNPQQVKYAIGLYPFVTMNAESLVQSWLVKITASRILCGTISYSVALLGLLPTSVSRVLVRKLFGESWSTTAVEATCSHLLQYHTIRNVLYMAMTEFQKLSEEPDWAFLTEKQNQIAFLFGTDDHWGPLTLFQEISKQVPDIAVSIEREGHTHAFSCSKAGSRWVAQHVVTLLKNRIQS